MDVVIIEDELLFADDLKHKLESLGRNINVKAVLASISEGEEWFSLNPEPDILFSDIRLSDGLSFDLLRSRNIKCPVIFTTAYENYAIEAFEFNSIQYLLKPVKLQNLEEALNKSMKVSSIANISKILSSMDFSKADAYSATPQSFFITRGDSYYCIRMQDIAAIKSESRQSVIYLTSGQDILAEDSLKEIEQKLNPKFFKRISRQWIINLNAVERISPKVFGGGELLIRPNITIPLARDKYLEVVKKLTN